VENLVNLHATKMVQKNNGAVLCGAGTFARDLINAERERTGASS
jgi:hypothetical protein